jgi:hypothetical protein
LATISGFSAGLSLGKSRKIPAWLVMVAWCLARTGPWGP